MLIFYYSGYFTDTWYPNNGYGFSSQPLSFSMYANQNTDPLVVQTQPLLTTPYVIGQTYNYDFLVGDDDFGSFLNVFGNNDFIGSYNLPSFTNATHFQLQHQVVQMGMHMLITQQLHLAIFMIQF